MKSCNTCGGSFPPADFYADRNTRDGLRRACKSCCRAQARQWAADNPRAQRERCRRNYRANIEVRRAKARARYHQLKEATSG